MVDLISLSLFFTVIYPLRDLKARIKVSSVCAVVVTPGGWANRTLLWATPERVDRCVGSQRRSNTQIGCDSLRIRNQTFKPMQLQSPLFANFPNLHLCCAYSCCFKQMDYHLTYNITYSYTSTQDNTHGYRLTISLESKSLVRVSHKP